MHMAGPQDPYGTPGEQPAAQPPSFPTVPGQNDFPVMQRPEPPSNIRNAVKLMYVGAALAAMGVLFLLFNLGSLREEIAQQDPGLTSEEVDAFYTMTVGSGLVLGLIAVGLWIWMAETNKRGLGWARIVATVLGGLNILVTLLMLGVTSGVDLILSLVSIVLAAAILWLLYRPDSSAYYRAVSSMRR
jgi:hypothetical protein